jgi:hypothetical protein
VLGEFPDSSPASKPLFSTVMLVEFTRLAFGLLLLLFHRPIADYLMEQERALVVVFRQRGLPLPAAPSNEVGRNIYFCIGTFVVFCQFVRIWIALHA